MSMVRCKRSEIPELAEKRSTELKALAKEDDHISYEDRVDIVKFITKHRG